MFKTVQTIELSGAALDWAVAKCEGTISGDALDVGFILEGGYSPSTDWAQGGPIIEREGVALGKSWESWKAFSNTNGGEGPTPLIAAMRCFVASKLGDTVEVPAELLEPV